MDFDEDRIYYSHQQLQVNNNDNTEIDGAAANPQDEEDAVDLKVARRHFREFLRKYKDWKHVREWTAR